MRFDNVVTKLSVSIQKSLLNVLSEVANFEEFSLIPDELAQKIAVICLTLMEETKLEEEDMMQTCFVLTNSFISYSYPEFLEKAIGLIAELETSIPYESGEELNLWEKAKEYFLKFLDGEEISDYEEIDED